MKTGIPQPDGAGRAPVTRACWHSAGFIPENIV